ncbi:MAG: HEPN domain-containing protein [Candidatus Caldarchaeum sp.]
MKEEYKQLADKLVEQLQRFFGERLVSVVFYGSVARGEERSDSDIDVLIVADRLPESRLRRHELFMQAESSLQPLIDDLRRRGLASDFSPILLDRDEASRIRPLYLDMVHDAVIVYDRDGFFTVVLSRLRKRLEELGAKRVRRGRLWYWDLKLGLNSRDMAESYLRQAAEPIKHAEEALAEGSHAYVIRQCQEVVELSLKAALRLAGIEPPKWHDVGPLLKEQRHRFKPGFSEKIDTLASYSRKLRREREPSMYGDEETGTPPERLYTRSDAEEALGMAKYVYEACMGLL